MFSLFSMLVRLVDSLLARMAQQCFTSSPPPLVQLHYICTNFPLPCHDFTLISTPYEIKLARMQAMMLSGRYRTQQLMIHWSSNNEMYCLLPSCSEQTDNLSHILQNCSSLQEVRDRMCLMWTDHLADKPHVDHIVNMCTITHFYSHCHTHTVPS